VKPDTPLRLSLRHLCGAYHTFHALFIRLGFDKSTGEKTALLRQVRIGNPEGAVVAEHLWVKCRGRKEWRAFRQGDLLELVAQPAPYLKGRPNDEENPLRSDYTLGGIQSIRKATGRVAGRKEK